MNHNINLTGYTATCGEPNNMLDLGTAGSYGLEKLHVTADAAWNGLTITATFTNSGSTTVAVSDGAVDVPPEATRLPTRDRVRYGMIAFKGVDAQGKLRIISTPIYYKVQASAATDGSNTIDPTPDQYAQFVAEVMAEADRAEAAADRAESAGGNVTPEQIAAAVNNYLNENPVQATPIDATLTQSGQAADAKAVGDAIADIELTPGPVGATPNIQIGTVYTLEAGSAATASMTGTAKNPLLNLGIPKGADGSNSGSGNDGGWKQAGFVQSETDNEVLGISGLDTKSVRLVIAAAAYASDTNIKGARIKINDEVSILCSQFIKLTDIKVTVIEIHLITTENGNYIYAQSFPPMQTNDTPVTSVYNQNSANISWAMLRVDSIEKIESITFSCTNGVLLAGSKLNVEMI